MTHVRTHWLPLLSLLGTLAGLFLLALVLLPAYTPYSLYEVSTASMVPRIPVGSIAIVDRNLTRAVPGEIIAFHPPDDPGQTFTHIVVHVYANGSYTTHGTANIYDDPWTVPPHDTVGTVIHVYPWLGWGITTLSAAAVLTLCALLIYTFITYGLHAHINGRFLVITVLALTCIYLMDVERPLVHANVEFTAISSTYASVHVINSGWIPVRAVVPHERNQTSAIIPANATLNWTFHRTASNLIGTVQVNVLPTPSLTDWIVFLAILLMPFALVLWGAQLQDKRQTVSQIARQDP
ncbi:MAG: S24/S26 family peptidase [Candidatus Dormibacteria bacterium]